MAALIAIRERAGGNDEIAKRDVALCRGRADADGVERHLCLAGGFDCRARFDAGVFLGLTTVDPTIGFTTGFTYVFNAFTIP